MLVSCVQTRQDFVRALMLPNGCPLSTFLGNHNLTSGLLPSEGPLHCALTSSIKLSHSTVLVFLFQTHQGFVRTFMLSNGFLSPTYLGRLNFKFITLWRSTPLCSFLFYQTITLETCKVIYAFEWLSLTIFCRNFDHPSAFSVYYPLKVHYTVLVPLLFKHIRNL